MDAQKYLSAADSITVNRVTFDYTDSQGQLQPGTTTINGFCPDKNPNELKISIDLANFTESFGFALNVNALFIGTVIDQNSVLWSVDQEIGRYVPEYDVTVDKIKGQFTTLLTAVFPADRHPGCDGIIRDYELRLDTEEGQNEFIITAHKTIAATDFSDEIHLTNFALQATAGQQTDAKVQIIAKQNHCRTLLVEGQIAKLSAFVSGFSQVANISYQWNVQGAVPPTMLTSVSIDLKLPSPPPATPIMVGVTVTDDDAGHSVSAQLSLHVLSQVVAARINAACQLISELKQIYFRRPPYDPGDFAVYERGRSFSQRDLRLFEQIANRLVAAGERFRTAIRGTEP